MTVPYRSNFKADTLPVAYTGQQATTNGQKHATIVRNHSILGHQNGVTQMDMMTSTFPKKLTGTRTISRPATTTTMTTPSLNTILHFWINLSKHGKKARVNSRTVQEALAAANAAADMSRRTWTRARQLMKDVHRSRGYFPVSEGNSMDVDQGKGKSRGKKGRFRTGKGNPREKGKGKSKGRRPGPCLLC